MNLGLSLNVACGCCSCCRDTTPGGEDDVLLQEDGDAVLQETGSFIVVED